MNEFGSVAAPSTGFSAAAMAFAGRYKHWLAAAVALLVLPYIPGLSSDFGRSLLSQMGIAAVFALSFNVLLGQTGLLSFGHAVYFGLGGYAAIHFMRVINLGLPLPVPLVPLAGAAAGLLCGALFGSVTTRRSGTRSRAGPPRRTSPTPASSTTPARPATASTCPTAAAPC